MTVVDEQLALLSGPKREALEHIRSIIHELVPDVEECISYGMPGFKYKGAYLAGFAAFRDHLSLFPTAGPVAALRDSLHNFVTAKGTIQFTAEHPIPEPVVRKIIAERIREIDGNTGSAA